jgi:hypothetical protein
MSEGTQTVSNTVLPRTAAPSPAVAQEPKRRRGRAAAKLPGNFCFYDGSVSPDGTIASIGKPFDSEIDAQKACARSGKPYLKIETLRVEFAVIDGKLVAVATPAKKQ